MKYEIPRNFKYVMMAIHLSYNSLIEIKSILSYKPTYDESIKGSELIKFYTLTLHYMLVMELCKLIEKFDKSWKNKNYASLEGFNHKVKNLVEDQNNYEFEMTNNELLNLRSSEIFDFIKTYRDKKLAHVDRNLKENPLSFKLFSFDELSKIETLLKDLVNVLNKIIKVFDMSTNLSGISKTSTTLRNYDDYKSFSFSNYAKFKNWDGESF